MVRSGKCHASFAQAATFVMRHTHEHTHTYTETHTRRHTHGSQFAEQGRGGRKLETFVGAPDSL
jgi:ABC-type nickel/cobalt efflux system permease component RcnA